MRRAAKVDDNQSEIVDAFRKLGYSVRSTAMIGQGFPDLAIGKFGHTWLVEVKDGRKPPSKRLLTPQEEQFWRDWNGSLLLINSINDVIEFDRKHARK